jgi:predicted AlkP superfamily pyrophosphatase or phosphodiesterase
MFIPQCRFAPVALLLTALALVAASGAAAPAAEFVVHISVDGLHPGHLQRAVDAGEAPTFKRMQAESAWTPNARTDYSHSVTLPNHTCMLTGRPTLQPDGMTGTLFHGYTSNSLPRRGATLHNNRRGPGHYVASTFDVIHDAGRSTALFASKDKFVIYEQSYDATAGGEHERGRDKIDVYYYQDEPAPTYCSQMNERFLADMAARRFNYVFVHYRDPDTVGHAQRWGSGAYHQALRTVDGYLADLLRLLENDPALSGKTTIILSADHGGIDFDHQDASLAEDYTIPLFVWGAGVKAGDLYAMNADTRSDPGTGRPDYNAPRQPIRNGDGANLALSLLGLGPVPGSLINARQDLRISK